MKILASLAFVFFLQQREILTTREIPDRTRAASDYSLAELYKASRNTATYDQGLTAEWILSGRRFKRGLVAEAAIDDFVVAVEARTQLPMPAWFKERLLDESQGKLTIKGIKGAPMLENSEIIAIAKEYKIGDSEMHGFFGLQHPEINAVLATDTVGICSDLLLFSDPDGRKASIVKIETWCPAVSEYNDSETNGGKLSEFVRSPSISVLFRKDGRLVFYGDVNNALFVSVFDPITKKCEMSFVSIQMFEAACIECSAPPKPSMG